MGRCAIKERNKERRNDVWQSNRHGQEPGSTGPVPTMLHGMISTGSKGNRVYFGYGTNGGGIVQIIDREKLLKGAPEPTPENLLYPRVGRMDLSTLLPG